ncbi:uncharacterized protein LOC131258329 isoform X2 [Magnolia sinica]|uniref:uncharacterized protein LOC131258329 isoform X2 n=2 Tax=Magnolia sinica TaxID=86752 RepID=UPI002657AEAB|nr:uncharacterized protein LOC131258329 isoform X2 [Magnolia sinica]
MADAALQIEEIESLLLSSDHSRGARASSAYSALLHFQELSANEPLAIQALAHRSSRFLLLICSDASHHDEELAAQALKCLGFMIYHPSLVSSIQEGLANLVMECLVKLITTTEMKVICNLGVWCISIQQFKASFIATNLHSLLRALIHALDNHLGSLSTTFEAIQAIMKLGVQLSEMMRDMSNVWAPPLYRRLLSTDKKERDMSERCLLKIKSSIFPPTLNLSKALAVDLKKTLLPRMKYILQGHGKKLHAIQAWGWYIRLLGLIAVKNRHLVNEMLKIPEQTFSDPDPQVQIATQVAWEGLIDALTQPQLLVLGANTAHGHCIQQNGPFLSAMPAGNCEKQVNGLSKRLKLIMVPILGVISSKCDISVRSSCLNTWRYLLHKLHLSVNYASVVKTVLEPILEVIFRLGPNDKCIGIWNSCVDLLHEFISSKVQDQVSSDNMPTKTTSLGPAIYNGSWKDYRIRWLPWDLHKLDFHLRMVRFLVTQGLTTTASPEIRKLALDASLRIFVAVLEGVQVELTTASNGFNEIFLCINTVLEFVRWASEEMTSKFITVGTDDLLFTALQFVEAVKDELEPSILASPLYRVLLDLKYIDDLQSANDIEYLIVLGISFPARMDMVCPMVYLTTIYLYVVAQSVLFLSKAQRIPFEMQYSKFIFSLSDSSENLHAAISLLYMHGKRLIHEGFYWLKIWKVVSVGLKERIDAVSSLNFLKTESDSTGHVMVYWFLCYPFFICYSSQRLSTPAMTTSGFTGICLVLSHTVVELELVIEVWKLLYDSANRTSKLWCSHMNSFSEGLSELLITMFGKNIISGLKENKLNFEFLFVFGEVAINLLKQIKFSAVEDLQSRARSNQEDGNYKECSDMEHILELVARFLELSVTSAKTNLQAELSMVSRVFAAVACFLEHLFVKQDVLLFMEKISNPLVHWLSLSQEILEGDIIYQLGFLWTQTLDCLRRIQPPLSFDSSFLGIQAPLLQTTLDHPYLPIADATISFWKSSYGAQITLLYPQCLLPVLDKLSREGRIRFHRANSPSSLDDSGHNVNSAVGRALDVLHRSQKRNLKRVEFMQDSYNHIECVDVASLGNKNQKRLKSTSMEVRAAPQERGRDCDGTYKNVDFVRQRTDLQENHELRNSKLIIDMLRRVR